MVLLPCLVPYSRSRIPVPAGAATFSATSALDEIGGLPKNVDDMTDTERQIAAVGEQLCVVMSYIQEASATPGGDLTRDEIDFLIWSLGFVQGRLQNPVVPMDETVKQSCMQRCQTIWPKLSRGLPQRVIRL